MKTKDRSIAMDREKVISAYECVITRGKSVCECGKCNYYIKDSAVFFCDNQRVLTDALALLKKQEAQKFFVDESGKITPLPVVVRCKDCKWRGTNACFCKARDDVRDDWFCSEWERKEGR